MTTSMIIDLDIYIEASRETVFEYLIDPKKITAWMGQAAVLEPRPGGVHRVQVSPAYTAVGEYLEVVPPERVVYTWGWEADMAVPPGSSTVEVTLVAEGKGTRVRLVHRDLPNRERLEGFSRGWTHYLGRLREVLEGRDPGPDTFGKK